METIVFISLTLLILIYLSPRIFYSIPAGHVGVAWLRFFGGTVIDPAGVRAEGLRLMFPWDRLIIYDTRLRTAEADFDVLSSDGLKLTINIAWRYRLDPRYVGALHKFIGADYEGIIIKPEIGSTARDILAKHLPEEIYTERRVELQGQILAQVRQTLYNDISPPGYEDANFIILQDVLIRGMTLPEVVQDAIVAKNVQYHQMQEYDFRILKEQKESERRRIEALGVRQFQDIVSYGITDSYLRWRGIEATLELAQSPNAKMVVIGAGEQGMPLILGNWESPGTQEPTALKPGPTPAPRSAGEVLGEKSAGPPVMPTTSRPGPNPASQPAGEVIGNKPGAPPLSSPPPTSEPQAGPTDGAQHISASPAGPTGETNSHRPENKPTEEQTDSAASILRLFPTMPVIPLNRGSGP